MSGVKVLPLADGTMLCGIILTAVAPHLDWMVVGAAQFEQPKDMSLVLNFSMLAFAILSCLVGFMTVGQNGGYRAIFFGVVAFLGSAGVALVSAHFWSELLNPHVLGAGSVQPGLAPRLLLAAGVLGMLGSVLELYQRRPSGQNPVQESGVEQ